MIRPTADTPADVTPHTYPHHMLTPTEQAVLDFASRTYRYPGAREADVHTTFGWTAARHAQVENALIDREDALAYAPQTVKRLRRLRDLRAVRRSA